jgi:hypothetical protein
MSIGSRLTTAPLRARLASLTLLVALACAPPGARAATVAELEAQVQALAQQVDVLKSQIAALKPAESSAAQSREANNAAPTPGPSTALPSEAPEQNPSLFGYGEISYSNPSASSADATADVARFVLGVGYRFDAKTRFLSEVEIEHTVSSAEDAGEVEVEQAFIEREITSSIFGKGGLLLIPVGMLNETHEPTRYYGVFRNFVETRIIPTTWREGGVAVQGNTAGGLRWDAGLTTGFDLSKWDPTSQESEESPLGSIHQELALAKAEDVSGFVALNYTGVPALRLGASVFSGGGSQNQPGVPSADVTLWEAHARWTPANWDFAALYAHGHISDTQQLNLAFVGEPFLIPEDFFGWYAQTAYRVWESTDWSLIPFIRYERFNTASSFADLSPGLTPAALPDQSVWTAGFNLMMGTGVVIKADYVDFRNGAEGDRFDLGLGYAF